MLKPSVRSLVAHIVISPLGLEYSGESIRDQPVAFEDYGQLSYQDDEMGWASA